MLISCQPHPNIGECEMNKQAIQQKIAELQALLDEPEAPADKPNGFPLKNNDGYFHIGEFGDVLKSKWIGDEFDIARLKSGNIFLTEQDATDKLQWDINQHALFCEAAKNEGDVAAAISYDGFLVYGQFLVQCDVPRFSCGPTAENAYCKILGGAEAIKAHLTFKSKAVKFTEVV